MKRRVGMKFKRVLTIAMSAIMVLETINCVSITASASAGTPIELSEELETNVNDAESAAIAADEAAIAADAALQAAKELTDKAADAALEVAEDGSYTETITDEDGNEAEVPVLKKELDALITDAETKVEDANDANAEVIADTQKEIDELAAEAVVATDAELQKAEEAAIAAAEAAQKAKDELAKAQAAGDYFVAQEAAIAADSAYKEAKNAVTAAEKAYKNAQTILEAAQKAVDEAVAACEAAVDGDAAEVAQKAIDDAQAALDAAKAIVDQAQAEYDAAKENLDAAKAAAEAAAAKVATIADGIVEDLEDAKGVDVSELSKEKDTANEDLLKAEEDKVLIDEEQDAIIAQATLDKDSADKQIAAYDKADKLVEDLEYRPYLGLGTSEITKLKELASKTTNDIKEYKWVSLKRVPVYYTQAEIDAAKAKVAEYDEAKDLLKNTNRNALKQASADAQKQIDDANNAKVAAALAIANKKTEIAGMEASMRLVTDYIYNNPEADVYDLTDNATYLELLEQMKAAKAQYDKSKDKREEYEDTIDRNWWNLFESLKKLFKELNVEFTDNGDYFNWSTLSIDTEYGKLTLVPGHNKENVTTLINIENGKLAIAKIDELEYATYAATFDKVAAAEAAARAAQAALEEQEAKNKLEAAKLALELAQDRLNKAKLKKLDLEKAKLDLAQAEENVELTKAEWEAAKKSAEEAKEAAEEAKEVAETKPVVASYYVLNRGLAQPAEVFSYPKPNYSEKPIFGELYSGVLDEETGIRDYSYIPLYEDGIAEENDVPQYLKVVPTEEQLAEVGIELKEGEFIKWYVIKTENDGYHVDGIIGNQRFTINVLYGYIDEDGNFVEFVKEDGTTYEQSGVFVLGDTFTFDSPIIDDYVAETDVVTGVTSSDMTIRVTYTKEDTQPVKINYFRGSLTGTLLDTVSLDVAVSKVSGYASVITENWLNTKKPADCNDGVLINYYYDETEGCWIANIVYSPIPVVIPVPNPEPTPTPEPTPEPTPVPEVIPEEEVPLAPTPVTPAPNPPVVPVDEDEEETEEVVEINDEDTPLADGDVVSGSTTEEAQEVVNIEEEETPLAAGPCWIHWLILIITAVYTLYELVRGIMRNKKINKLAENRQSVEA